MKPSMTRELIVDSFAGGGGASLGIEMALGRSPDIAINHDEAAIAMHAANHPDAKHCTEDVWKVSPHTVTKGKAVGLLWASPDCCHFSRAKGAKPVKKEIRSLAWVVIKWAAQVRPRVIILENVREFEDWGPLIPKKIDGIEQTLEDGSPVLIPDPTRKGHSFRRWVGRLKALGYEVQWRAMNAADYGAPTHRRRLFLVARCDGESIVWPEPTHGDPKKIGERTLFSEPLQPWKTAAECIDWSIPCPSIFTRKKPLAENTLRRIAMGIKRYVLENPKPFIVQVNHGGAEFRGQSGDEPLSTVTGKHGYGLATPVVARIGQTGGNGSYSHKATDPLTTVTSKAEHFAIVPHVTKFRGNSVGSGIDEPLPTVTSGAGAARPAGAAHAMGVVAASVVRCAHGGNGRYGSGVENIEKPLPTQTASKDFALMSATLVGAGGPAYGAKPTAIDSPLKTVMAENHQCLVSAFLAKHYGGVVGHELERPIGTVTAWDHHSLVAANLVRFNHDDAGVPIDAPAPTTTTNNHTALVYSFLTKYFGTAIGANLIEPAPTATGKDRFGLVTVQVDGEPYVIVDIGMRMLSPRELARAQGFPDSYILTGSKSNQVARIGNSVCPVVAKVLVEANYKEAKAKRKRKAATA